MPGNCEYSCEIQTDEAGGHDSEHSSTWSCPHETHDDTDRCLFHLDPSERRERDIAPATVGAELTRLAEQEGKRSKQVVGATFTDVALEHIIVDAPDKHPLDLRQITISGRFSIESAEIRQPLNLSGASLADVRLQEATLTERCTFEGATIDETFDASATVFEEDADFEYVQFRGTVCFEETRFHGDTCLRDTVYEDAASFDGVEFRGDANLLDDDACFARAAFGEEATFRKAKFRYADFNNVTFTAGAEFDEAVFTGDAEFSEADFGAEVSFRGTEFYGDANVLIDDADFSDAAFAGPAVFESAEFSLANFENATFEQKAHFEYTTFTDDAMFSGVSFAEDALFDEARFNSDTRFDETAFGGDASFRGVEFQGGHNIESDDVTFADAEFVAHADFSTGQFRYANFTDVVFDRATFDDATFDGRAEFAGCQFGEATFDEACFNSDTRFDETTFDGEASFRGVEFRGGHNIESDDVTFADAEFIAHADFSAGRFRYANFTDVVFDRATFNDAIFDGRAEFTGAQFSEATFNEVRFRLDSAFDATRFGGTALFRGTEFQGGDNIDNEDVTFDEATFEGPVDFIEAEFRYSTFADVVFGDSSTFDSVTFTDDAEFDGATFRGPVTFDEARFTDDAAFARTTFDSSASFRGTEFHGGDNVVSDDLTFQGAEFAQSVDFEAAVFRAATFTGIEIGGEALFDETIFKQTTSFQEGHFRDETTFEEARFYSDVSFGDVAFEGDASFRGAEFHGGDNIRDDDLDFSGATFEGGAQFTRAEFEYTNFRTATICGPANFEETTFADKAVFTELNFADTVSFAEATFQSDAIFRATNCATDASFFGVEFKGSESERDDAVFDEVTFEGSVDFRRIECDAFGMSNGRVTQACKLKWAELGQVTVDDARFQGTVELMHTTYDKPVSFEGTVFEGEVNALEARFDSDASFAGATFKENSVFKGVEFRGGAHTIDDADFEAAVFGETADFEMAKFRYANFASVEFDDNAIFIDTSFARGGLFQGSEFAGSGLFSRAFFGDETDFSSTEFHEESHFDEVQFRADTTFADAVFEQDATFAAAEFEGSSNRHDDDATFESATFLSDATFEQASFRYASFVKTEFGGCAKFVGADFEREVEFRPRPIDADETLVNLRKASLPGGELAQPESGSVYYDLARAEIAAVTFVSDYCEHPLFDHLRIFDTKFRGFDFTSHKAHLAESNWVLHRFAGSHLHSTESDLATEPAELENTYLKAKNAAAELGDRKAASEFFIKEMVYRGQKNWEIAAGRTIGSTTDISIGSRLRASGKWGANKILYQTCGYGERLWRVVYVSGIAILFWALLYTVIPDGLEEDGTTHTADFAQLLSPEGVEVIIENLYFSAATFITLEYVTASPGGSIARWAASIEAYTGALLIAMFVFVLGRRVAW